jgi:hypothetical protein
VSKRSKEKPALADWAVGTVGTGRKSDPVVRAVSLSFRREGLVFTDAADRVLLVVSLAPGMFVERLEPVPADADGSGFEDETRQSGFELTGASAGPEIRPVATRSRP